MIPEAKVKRYRDLLNRIAGEDPDNNNEIKNAVRILREMEKEYPGIREAAFGPAVNTDRPAGSIFTPHIESFVKRTLSTMEEVASQAVTDFLKPASKEPTTVSKKPATSETETRGLGSLKDFEKRLYAEIDFGVDADTIDTIDKLCEGTPIDDLCKSKAYQAALRQGGHKKSPTVLIEIRLPLDVVLGVYTSEAKAECLGIALHNGLLDSLGEPDDEEEEEGEEEEEEGEEE